MIYHVDINEYINTINLLTRNLSVDVGIITLHNLS